ncbi:MAG TPA: hypothetical protein VGQ42_12875 [Candidatus Dormibacteraeota bacterium]|nr:hypothetical protein [Candidatus Dormibacteraeota bacterium]
MNRETVRDLTTPELQQAAGGRIQSVGVDCVASLVPPSCGCTGYYPSINAPCTTN